MITLTKTVASDRTPPNHMFVKTSAIKKCQNLLQGVAAEVAHSPLIRITSLVNEVSSSDFVYICQKVGFMKWNVYHIWITILLEKNKVFSPYLGVIA